MTSITFSADDIRWDDYKRNPDVMPPIAIIQEINYRQHEWVKEMLYEWHTGKKILNSTNFKIWKYLCP